MYYEEDQCQMPECCGCKEHDKTIDNIKDFFEGILEILYTPNNLNIHDLEYFLEQIGADLGMKIPSGKIQIRKSNPIESIAQNWAHMNNKYLKTLIAAGE